MCEHCEVGIARNDVHQFRLSVFEKHITDPAPRHLVYVLAFVHDRYRPIHAGFLKIEVDLPRAKFAERRRPSVAHRKTSHRLVEEALHVTDGDVAIEDLHQREGLQGIRQIPSTDEPDLREHDLVLGLPCRCVYTHEMDEKRRVATYKIRILAPQLAQAGKESNVGVSSHLLCALDLALRQTPEMLQDGAFRIWRMHLEVLLEAIDRLNETRSESPKRKM